MWKILSTVAPRGSSSPTLRFILDSPPNKDCLNTNHSHDRVRKSGNKLDVSYGIIRYNHLSKLTIFQSEAIMSNWWRKRILFWCWTRLPARRTTAFGAGTSCAERPQRRRNSAWQLFILKHMALGAESVRWPNHQLHAPALPSVAYK